MRTLKMQCRYEELPFLADFARDYFVRDISYFTEFSPDFGDSFLQKYDSQAKLVNELVTPSLLMAEQKAITGRIRQHYTTARNFVNKVERYAELAAEAKLLKVNVSDFGFKNIRKELDRSNDEAVTTKLNELLQHTDANFDALEAKGFTQAYRQELAAFVTTFATDVKDQERKMYERASLVKENIGQFNALWDMVSNILDTGKVICKEKDKSKLKDYTYAELIKKVRVERKKKEDNGDQAVKG